VRRIKSAVDGEPTCALEVGPEVESLAVLVGPAPLFVVLVCRLVEPVGLVDRGPDVGADNEELTLETVERARRKSRDNSLCLVRGRSCQWSESDL
jgi:hypothetical protein